MKIVSLFLTILSLQVSARGEAQTVTLSLKNEPIDKAFIEIERQTGYVFIYGEALIKLARPVTILVKNESLETVLLLCFKDQPLMYNIVDRKYIVIKKRPGTDPPLSALSEERKTLIDVKGRVLNEKGDPVPEVTVNVKGTNTSTVTNSNGEFQLFTVEAEAILVFTHVGMESFELNVSGKTEIVVNLKTKITALGNVEVLGNTGYQEIQPNRMTGSYSVINSNALNQQVGRNILQRLEGITTAVLFDNKQIQGQKRSNITIRGLSSINGPMDPLIVLDGFIYEGDINNINPNLVSEITILKDAAAASIWGARAGNGVIVITTKRGMYNQKLQVSVNANVIINSKQDLYYFPEMSAVDYINVEQFLYRQGAYDFLFNDPEHGALSPAVEIFRLASLGLIPPSDSAAQINALKSIDIRDEYNKHFYGNAINQQYSVNLSGGGAGSAYIMSLGYDRGMNEVDDKLERYNVHFKNSFRPVRNLEVGVDVYYTKTKNLSGKPGYGTININGRQVPYLRFADSEGSPLAVALTRRKEFTDTAGGGKLLNWEYYPLEDYKHNKTSSDLSEVFASATAKYSFFNFLSAEVRYQYQQQQVEFNQVLDYESFEARNLINLFSQIDYSTGDVTRIIPAGGVKKTSANTVESQTLRAQLNLDREWKKHKLGGILGSEIREYYNTGYNFSTYGYNADPLSNGLVDFLNPYPTFITGETRFISGTPQNSPRLVNKFASLYLNLSYVFDEKYVLSISGRRDGSNVFGANTNDKWKPLWSAGIGWNISEEKFYKSKLFPHLKIRSTYGFSGNVDLSKTAIPVAAYNISTHPLTNLRFGSIGTLNNPNLRWEQVRTINFALEFATKNNIVNGTIEYYIKKASDLYGPAPFDYTAWGDDATIIKNVANLDGSGVEITVNTKNLNKALTWNTTLMFTYQSNKTAAYFSPEANQLSQLIGFGNRITPVVGKPLYAIAAYRWGGLDDLGNPQGYLDGQLSTDYVAILNEANTKAGSNSIVYVGSSLPTKFGSLINTFSYKNISLSANIAYKLGYVFRKSSISYGTLIEFGRGHKDYARRWQNPGDENITDVPAMIFPNVNGRDAFYNYSEANVLKGDHIRLLYINIAYTFQNKSSNRAYFKDVQVYLNASNLGILWRKNKEDLDPEYPSDIQPTKSWAVGLRANF